MVGADFEHSVIAVVRSIPAGCVLSYGEVALEAGHPGAARAVGNLLRTTVAELPWWRVVGSGGRLVAPAWERQRDLLWAEGVTVIGRLVR